MLYYIVFFPTQTTIEAGDYLSISQVKFWLLIISLLSRNSHLITFIVFLCWRTPTFFNNIPLINSFTIQEYLHFISPICIIGSIKKWRSYVVRTMNIGGGNNLTCGGHNLFSKMVKSSIMETKALTPNVIPQVPRGGWIGFLSNMGNFDFSIKSKLKIELEHNQIKKMS